MQRRERAGVSDAVRGNRSSVHKEIKQLLLVLIDFYRYPVRLGMINRRPLADFPLFR
jgi:hypothetical protein